MLLAETTAYVKTDQLTLYNRTSVGLVGYSFYIIKKSAINSVNECYKMLLNNEFQWTI